jgi:transcription antitermination factor NusG
MPRSRKRRERPYRQSMPLLPRRLPMPRAEIDHGLAWRVAYCYRGSVARVRDRIEEVGIATYLPMEAFERITRNRRVAIERPALAGYLFVGLDAARPDYVSVEEAMGGAWCLPTEGRLLRNADGVPLHVPPMALERLSEALHVPEGSGCPFAVGAAVRARQGIWQAFLGEVERSDDYRVRVLLDVFGRKTPVEFGASDLEAAA